MAVSGACNRIFYEYVVRKPMQKLTEHVSALVFNRKNTRQNELYSRQFQKQSSADNEKDAQLLEKIKSIILLFPAIPHIISMTKFKSGKTSVINIVHETVKHIVDTVENVKNIEL